jgi:ribosomal protein S25
MPEVVTPPDKRELAVLAHLDTAGRVTTRDVQALFGIKPFAAGRVLRGLRERGVIVLGSKHAVGRGMFYVPKRRVGRRIRAQTEKAVAAELS